MIKFSVFAGAMLFVLVLCLFMAWRTADMQTQFMQQQSEYWKQYAKQLEEQARQEREAKGVEADIERLSDDGVARRMCEQGYLTDCPE